MKPEEISRRKSL